MGKLRLEEQAAPETPAADKVVIYPKAGGGVYKKSDDGVDMPLVEGNGALTTILVGGGANTKPVWTEATGSDAPVRATSPTIATPTINVGSDADGDTYHRASGVLARLAKGGADLKMFMNAGNTAPEWASGIKIGAITRDVAAADGTVAYSGVGFKLSNIIFICAVPATNLATFGFDDGTVAYSIWTQGADNWSRAPSSSIVFHDGGGTMGAHVSVLGADGFSLAWVKAGTALTGTAHIYYIAFR